MGVLIPRGRVGEQGAADQSSSSRTSSSRRSRRIWRVRRGVSPTESGGMSESSQLASEGHGCREASSHGPWGGG
jgi:hypothetical protein